MASRFFARPGQRRPNRKHFFRARGETVSRHVYSARRGGGHCEAGVYFDHAELRTLFSVYSRRVVSGEWRDYALDSDGRRAVFSAFRHSLALPHCTVEKLGRGAGFRLWRSDRGRIEARSIAEVLAALDTGPRLIARNG
jgi:Protein of unknown function (DUF2794)